MRLPHAAERGLLHSWTEGMAVRHEMARDLFADRIPESDDEIRASLIKAVLSPLPDTSDLRRRIALRLLEWKRDGTADTLATTGFSALRGRESPEFRFQALGTLYTVSPAVGVRFCYALAHCKNDSLKTLGMLGLQQNAPQLFFSRAYELGLEHSTPKQMRLECIQTVNASIGTGLFPEIPRLSYESSVRPYTGPQVAALAGVEQPPNEIRRDAVLAARILDGENPIGVYAQFARLQRLNPQLAIVAAAGCFALGLHSPCVTMRELIVKNAPTAASTFGFLP